MQDRGGSCAGLSQAKEHPAIPARAGNGARDGGERLKGAAQIFETIARDGHDMLDALILADQPRACDGALILADAAERDTAPINLLAERFQALARFRPQPAISQFLDAIGQPAFDIASAEGRWLLAVERAPLLLQVGDRGSACLLYTSPSPRDRQKSRMPSSA